MNKWQLKEAQKLLLTGAVLLNDCIQEQWLGIHLPNELSRRIATSGTETILYGAKDSFTEQLEPNITLKDRKLFPCKIAVFLLE